jgi:hypothetical protein
MKVTENLIEPPKFRLTRGLRLPLAPTLVHLRIATTGMSVMSVRLALMVQTTTNALSDDSSCLVETASKAGLGRIAAFQHRPGSGKGPPKTEVERLWPEQDDPLSVSSSTPVRHGGSTGRQGLPIQP